MQHFSSTLEQHFKQKSSFLLCTFKESANSKHYWSFCKLLPLQQISPAASLGNWLLYTLLRNYGYKTFKSHKKHEVLTRNRYYSLPQTVAVTARVRPNKATSLGIFQHITHSNPKLTIIQDGSFKLLPFKTRKSPHLKMFVHKASKTGSWTAQKTAWAGAPLWLVCVSWHKELLCSVQPSEWSTRWRNEE